MENMWFGAVGTKARLLQTCLKMRLSLHLSGTLYMQSSASILLPTLLGSHYACCQCLWRFDSKTNVTQNAAGPSHGSWYDATCSDYIRRHGVRWNKKHNQPFVKLQQQCRLPDLLLLGRSNLPARHQLTITFS